MWLRVCVCTRSRLVDGRNAGKARTNIGNVRIGVDDYDSGLVETATTSTAGHLGTESKEGSQHFKRIIEWERVHVLLAGQQITESSAVVLAGLVEDHALCRHIDSLQMSRSSAACRGEKGSETDHSEGLGSEKNLDETASEEKLDNLRERWL
jgi:hypothetical protein